MKKPFRLLRRGPDVVTEELAGVLSGQTWFEFKPLFLLIYSNLRARNLANGGEEMLRLRTYDKLQNLVLAGSVEKSGKSYRGVATALAASREHAAAEHCRELLAAVESAPPAVGESRAGREGSK